MPKNRIIIILGILVALMPLLGFPHAWESFMQIVFGLAIVILSVWATVDKRLTLKMKAQKRQAHKRREVEIANQNEGESKLETSTISEGNLENNF